MAVYFDHTIQSPIPGSIHTGIAWHNSYALLAVASKVDSGVGGIVNFYLDEGEIVEDSGIQRTSAVTCMSWHPSRKILAMGWANGEVMIWNEHDHELHEANSAHKGSVTVIQWSSNGNRLVTGDENGLVIVWRIDQRGRTSNAPLYQIDKKGSSVTYCVFKPLPSEDTSFGGQNSLDLGVWKKGSRAAPGSEYCFYFSCNDGNVYYVDDKGKNTPAFSTDGPLKTILFYEGKSIIVTVTEGLICAQHQQGHDGVYHELIKVKLSGQPSKAQVGWAGRGILATASGENIIRMWDLDLDDNFVLSLDQNGAFEAGECINCLSFSKSKGILAAGTSGGKVAMWKYIIPKDIHDLESRQKWEALTPSLVGGELKTIHWGGSKNLLAVSSEENVVILNEQVMNSHFNEQVVAVQVSPSQLAIQNIKDGIQHDLKTDIHIKGVFVTKEHTTIWNGKKVVVYEVSSDKAMVRAEGNFNSDSMTIVTHEQSVYTAEPGKIQVRNFQGTVKQVLGFSETEGDPILISVCGNYLVSGTSLGIIKMWDLSRREAKPHCNPKSFQESFPGVGRIRSIKCNCTGNKVSILCDKSNNTPDSCIYIWDVETDTFQAFDFAHGENVQKEDDVGDDDSSLKSQQGNDIKGRYPLSQFWDHQEARLLVCEAQYSSSLISDDNSKDKSVKKSLFVVKTEEESSVEPDVMVISLFSTPESGILLQDYFPLESSHNGMIGVDVPFFYFVKKATVDADSTSASTAGSKNQIFAQRTMRDFLGLEKADKDTKTAMMNFSYLSAIGNMDEAFKAIKLIKSESVWENMARMCVKTKRLDVASVCLGNMGNARAAQALRDAVKESELNARVALLAVQLGMTEEAEKLLKSCKRFDILNQFYQASNQWTKAIEIAELHDRIHLRTTYYNYAKHLETIGNVQAAITNYEKSDTHRFEVPRMLLDNPSHLESYIMKTKDTELRRWWAQYMESAGEMESALQFYEAAKDQLSLVRVYCYCGNLDKAAEICNDTGDRAASYHLARQYENQDNVKGAIHMYTRSQCYSNAIRLAKDHGLENDLMNLALLSTPEDMIDVARYYESLPNMQDKAVMLYHKGGQIGKALELCFATEQFSALQIIAEDLDENTDPDMLNKCAEFFLEHQQYDKAVELLIIAKKFNEALELCVTHNVIMTEELAEKMTLPKDTDKPELRTALLEKIGEVCMIQQQYHLATKKYTQAGNKIKAMKALLKSGDTEKIVFFAGVSRQREIYVMAANYLQSLDWRKDPDIMKNIIGFYTKGRALDSLAGFYDACAQVEIDEYQNYDKALGALTEAYKCISKAKMKNVAAQEEKAAFLKQRITLVKKFVQARRLLEEDPTECMKHCEVLLEEPDLETAVRVGDVFGIMIEHYGRKENNNKAYQLMQDMRQRIPGVNMAYYVNMRTIEAVHKALDIPLGRGMGAERIPNGVQDDEEEGEEVEEEVEEDYD